MIQRFYDKLKEGQQMEYEPVLKEVFGRDYADVKKRMEETCRTAFKTVEAEVQRQSGLPVGELGLDVLFVGKNPYIIEGNSRCVVDTFDPYFERFKETLFQAGEYSFRQAGLIRRLS